MLDWEEIATRVEEALTDSQMVLLGQPVGISPKTAAIVATNIIREDVTAHINTIPRVPTNKYDMMMAMGVFAFVGVAMVGVYKIMQAEEKS